MEKSEGKGGMNGRRVRLIFSPSPALSLVDISFNPKGSPSHLQPLLPDFRTTAAEGQEGTSTAAEAAAAMAVDRLILEVSRTAGSAAVVGSKVVADRTTPRESVEVGSLGEERSKEEG